MAKKDVITFVQAEAEALAAATPEPTDYSKLSMAEVLEVMGKAFAAKDMKLVGQLSKLYAKKDEELAKAKKDAALAKLAVTTANVLEKFRALAEDMIEGRTPEMLDVIGATDGIWFAYDFGAVRDANNPALKLTKAARRAPSEGGSGGKSSYVANPTKSADMLAQVGNNVYLEKDTEVTIDKVTQTLPAGLTFQRAYDLSTNGGWRNRVRQALLKEAGLI